MISTDTFLWALEELFWTGDATAALASLDPACVMAFPAPAGILSGEAIHASITAAPRWSAVAMTELQARHPAPGFAVLSYRACGVRAGAPPYEAFCISSYRAAPAGWRLVQHQQVPIG